MINIKINPVVAPTFHHAEFPSEYQPLLHQQLTFEIVKNYFTGSSLPNEIDIDFHSYFKRKIPIALINVAQTAEGKTLAASAPILRLEKDAIFSYPTNELIHDQKSTLNKYVQAFKAPHEIYEINRPTLLQLREQSPLPFPSQGAMWEHILKKFKTKIICTNPDIIYYSTIDSYRGTTVAQLVLHVYPVMVYDEFHLAEAKQQSGILLTVALAKTFEKPKVFIFLSATPPISFKERLEKIGVPVFYVQELEKCLHVARPESKSLKLVGEVDLQIYPYPAGIWSAGEWISENLELFKEHLEKNLGENIVVILDSVYEAKHLAKLIADKLKISQREVGQVHGWMNALERRNEIKKKIVVGSSAIEVGIDFRCSFLVFEAKTWSSFLQRLGRVARNMERGKAIAIVPKQVYRYLENSLKGRTRIDRIEMTELIKNSFRSFEDFQSYLETYMAIEGKAIFDRYINLLTRDEQSTYREKLYKTLSALTGKKESEIEELYRTTDSKVRKLLETYRGSEFQFAIFDEEDEQRGWFPFKFYGMGFVLRRCNFDIIGKDELYELLKKYKDSWRALMFVRDFDEMSNWGIVISPIKVFTVLDTPNDYEYALPEEEIQKIVGKVGVIRKLGLTNIRCKNIKSFRSVSKILYSREVIALAIQGTPLAFSEKYDLSPLFKLHPLKKIRGLYPAPGDYSIAFGLDAIMLDSLIKMGKISRCN